MQPLERIGAQYDMAHQANRRAKLGIQIRYAKEASSPELVIESQIAQEAAGHMIGMVNDALFFAEISSREYQHPLIGISVRMNPSHEMKFIDGFSSIAGRYKGRGFLGPRQFDERVSDEERQERIERGVQNGFAAGIRVLVPDENERAALINAYSWMDEIFQPIVPLEGEFKTIFPHASLAFVLDRDIFTHEWRTRLAVFVKRDKVVDPKNN